MSSMSTTSEGEAPASSAILARVNHLDISSYVNFKETKARTRGVYVEIFRHRCTLPTHGKIRVAVKRLRVYVDECTEMLLEKEIYAWSNLKHKNILPLLGFAFDKKTGYPLLVSEWMMNGSALDYARVHPECDLIHLVTGAAEGLAYLHKEGLVHSDIKTSNILISNSREAVICDFGLARVIDASKSMGNLGLAQRGTTRYLAYELVKQGAGTAVYSQKTDVWAFGITVFELFTLQQAYQCFEDIGIVQAILDGILPPRPTSCPWKSLGKEYQDLLWKVCERCWIRDSSDRWSMEKILEMLHEPTIPPTIPPKVEYNSAFAPKVGQPGTSRMHEFCRSHRRRRPWRIFGICF